MAVLAHYWSHRAASIMISILWSGGAILCQATRINAATAAEPQVATCRLAIPAPTI